ncbi:MAG: hypothetical protein EOL88_06380 [Bacteroidia bacterium]|nr:hypothetical protein [Bacteroidia bacterium]
MIPVVDNQYFRDSIFYDKAPFLTYKDNIPQFQVVIPNTIHATDISISICNLNDEVIATTTGTVIQERYKENDDKLIYAGGEITGLMGNEMYYIKIEVSGLSFYTEAFKTIDQEKIIDVRITQDGETRITQDSETRIVYG